MADVFLKIVNMSISASWLVLAVLVFRLVFKKAPKWIHVLLWGIVAVRLLCPFSIESALSLIPSAETISPEIMMSREPTIHTGVPAINSVVNPIITETFAPEPVASANPLQILIPVLAMIWGIGVALLLAYTAISYWRLRRRVRMAVLLRDNIYQSEAVSSPFVLGIIKPKIYLPFQIDGQDLEHVVSHEQAHIRRRDHWWKPLGFLLLTIHWFNPMMWLAYVLLCRDIELACDEKVVKELDKDQRADYSQALLACSVNRRMIAACPLAFGEVGVKERVKSVMNYKKPAFWVIVISVIACIVVAVCFLTNPKERVQDLMKPGTAWISEEYQLFFAMDEDNVIEGTFTDQNENTTISVGYRFAGKYNAVFDIYRGDWESAQKSSEAPLLAGMLKAQNGALVLEVEQDSVGLGVKQIVFSETDAELSDISAATAGKTYLYEKEGIMGSFTITLYDDGTFTYYEGMASSYLAFGTWKQEGDTITLTDDGHGGYGLVNHFRRDGDDLVFVEQDSDNFVYVKVKDGERFHCTGEAFKQNNGAEEDGSNQTLDVSIQDTFFTYDGIQYDLAERNGTINEITDYFQIGERLVLEGHTGPKHNIYCVFNTSTQSFETDFAGANLTWYGDNINTVVYSYWSDVFTYDGRCLASYELPENEYIYSLDYAEDGSQIEAVIISDTGDERTEIISPNAYVISYSDLNHNRVNEQIVVREVHPGQLYELAVLENGEEIWKTEAGLPHVGWNTIVLYSEGGQDYLVQYLPTMFQGIGSYTCTVFSLEGNTQTVKEEWSIDEFKLEAGDPPTVTETPEMERFAEAVDLIMRNSGVLLSTEQGVLVDRYTPASALPQIYPVRFEPNEIQRAMEVAADPTAQRELTANAAAFPSDALEFVFASGAGAWGTYLTLQPDGHFTGDYGDSDADRRYICKFEGQFTDIQQISDYCWAMKLGDVTIEKEEGTTWTENGIHYIAAGPHGVFGGTDFLLYAPGTPVDLIPAECRNWWPDAYRWRNGEIDILNGWSLCNLNEGTAFYTTWLQ